MTACPKCGSIEIQAHGSRVQMTWRKRWRLFGPVVAHFQPVAFNVSCANCLYAFVSRETGYTEAPVQTLFDRLQEAQGVVRGTDRTSTNEKPDKPKVVPMPRPAPDPRARRR